MANVTPFRRRPTLVEPGQSVEDAEWHAGWNACREDLERGTVHAYTRGREDGLRAGMLIGPSWGNLLTTGVLTFVIGLSIGLALFA